MSSDVGWMGSGGVGKKSDFACVGCHQLETGCYADFTFPAATDEAQPNIVNEIYDVRQGIDTIVSPRASHAIVKGRLTERTAFLIAGGAFVLAIAVGLYLVSLRGPAIADLAVSGTTRGTLKGAVELNDEERGALEKLSLYVQINSEKAPEGNLWGWLFPQEVKR